VRTYVPPVTAPQNLEQIGWPFFSFRSDDRSGAPARTTPRMNSPGRWLRWPFASTTAADGGRAGRSGQYASTCHGA
jgi:hypothetical protein